MGRELTGNTLVVSGLPLVAGHGMSLQYSRVRFVYQSLEVNWPP